MAADARGVGSAEEKVEARRNRYGRCKGSRVSRAMREKSLSSVKMAARFSRAMAAMSASTVERLMPLLRANRKMEIGRAHV